VLLLKVSCYILSGANLGGLILLLQKKLWLRLVDQLWASLGSIEIIDVENNFLFFKFQAYDHFDFALTISYVVNVRSLSHIAKGDGALG
jgi:hypothetical protein